LPLQIPLLLTSFCLPLFFEDWEDLNDSDG